MQIRKYNSRDQTQIIDLLRQNTPEFFHPSEEKDLLNYLEEEVEDYFVVEGPNAIIAAGGINYFLKERMARISWDLVHPGFQGQGIGKKLLLHRLHYLSSNEDVESTVVRTSQWVYGFYEKMGFSIQDIQKDYWAPGYHLYTLSR